MQMRLVAIVEKMQRLLIALLCASLYLRRAFVAD